MAAVSVGLPVEGDSVMICISFVVPMVGLIILLFLFMGCLHLAAIMVPSQLVFRTKTELKWPLGEDTFMQVVVNLLNLTGKHTHTHTLLASYVS